MPPPSKTASTSRAKSPNSWRRIGEGTMTRTSSNKENQANLAGTNSRSLSGLPFRPSGPKQEHVSPSQSPVRTKYWYSNSNQTGQKRSNKAKQESGTASPPRPSINNLHSFAVASNTANWQSESQNNYVGHTSRMVDPAAYVYPAGRLSNEFDRDGSSTDLITRNTEANKIEPANFKGDLVRQPSVTKHRVSEHEGNFQWPAVQHDVYMPSQDIQGLGLDGKMYKAVGAAPKVNVLEESDYERRLQELRRKQKDINQPIDAPTAGRPSKTKEDDVPEQAYYPYDLGASEYKMKFKEWPIDAPPAGASSGDNAAKGSSRVFPTAAGNAYSNLRQSSLYRESFPAYDAQDMTAAIPKVDGRANESHKPPSFAWSLVDGEKPVVPPDHHDAAHSQMGESEYTRKFNWPTASVYQSQRRASKGDYSSADSLAGTLFPVEHVANHVEPLLSEYRQQFYEKDIFGNDVRPHPSPKRDSNAPKQFAWALANGSNLPVDEEEDDAKVRRPRPVTTEFSEHTNKYKWPIGAEPHHLTRKPDENHELKVGKVYALDDDQRDPRQWATEYDEKYTKLRQRQRELAAAAAMGATEHVAGVPSASRPQIPSNFAWKEADAPPPPPSREPKHVSPDHFHTEYEEKFLAWKNAQAAGSANREDGSLGSYHSKLNLFEVQSYAQGSKGAKSEYDDRYRFLVPGGDESSVSHAKGRADSDAPPQFAWPLVDQPRPAPPSPTKPSKPLEKSEYETKFVWPTKSQPVKSFKPETDPNFASNAPMATEADASSAQWKTETQDPSAKKTKAVVSSSSSRPAGIVQIRDEDVPSFFAWAEAEAQRSAVVMPPPPPEVPTEVVNSEMRSEFRGHSPLSAPPAKIIRPAADSQVTKDEHPSTSATSLTSEYQANFAPADGAKVNKANVAAGVPSDVRQYRPPQFAWPRVDPQVSPAPIAAKSTDANERKFSDTTENNTRYVWPTGQNKTPVVKPGKATSSAAIDHFEGSVTLMAHPTQGKPSEWVSEYDARCAETQAGNARRARASSAPPALRATGGRSTAPPFFVWSPADAADALPAPAPLPKPVQQYPTETSEYREQFIGWQDAIEHDDTSNLRGTQKERPEQSRLVANLLCDPLANTAAGATSKLASEYGANFAAPSDNIRTSIVTHRDIQRPTLACTNLDKYTPMPPPPPAPMQSKVNPNAAMQFRTEYSDHFTWQEVKPAIDDVGTTKVLPKKNPTQRMKSQSVAVKRSIPHRSDANKENAGSTLQSTINQVVSNPPPTGTTEYRRQFSWPDAARKPNDVEFEREGPQHTKIIVSEAQRKQRLAEQKKRFHLMSKSMSTLRDNHYRSQPYNDGKDHATVRLPTFGRADRFPSSENYNDVAHGDDDLENALNTSAFAPYQTTISQDSLNVPHSSAKARPSTAASSTIVSDSECASVNQHTVSSSSAGHPSLSKVMPASPVSVSTTPSSPPPAAKNTLKDPSLIPGLRDYDPRYRARSAPARKVVGSLYADSAITRSGIFTDQSPSNPVLMHRRYPSISDRQRTRWSTETRDQFTSKVVRGRAPSASLSPK